jgi:hypothetical protein
MCLFRKWSDEEVKEYLKDKPARITCYKSVRVGQVNGGGLALKPYWEWANRAGYSPGGFRFKSPQDTNGFKTGWNKKKSSPTILTGYREDSIPSRKSYKAHFHCWVDETGGRAFDHKIAVQVPKSSITAIGLAEGDLTIVTKSFFVSKDEVARLINQ